MKPCVPLEFCLSRPLMLFQVQHQATPVNPNLSPLKQIPPRLQIGPHTTPADNQVAMVTVAAVTIVTKPPATLTHPLMDMEAQATVPKQELTGIPVPKQELTGTPVLRTEPKLGATALMEKVTRLMDQVQQQDMITKVAHTVRRLMVKIVRVAMKPVAIIPVAMGKAHQGPTLHSLVAHTVETAMARTALSLQGAMEKIDNRVRTAPRVIIVKIAMEVTLRSLLVMMEKRSLLVMMEKIIVILTVLQLLANPNSMLEMP